MKIESHLVADLKGINRIIHFGLIQHTNFTNGKFCLTEHPFSKSEPTQSFSQESLWLHSKTNLKLQIIRQGQRGFAASI
jgi:hypothetical protein